MKSQMAAILAGMMLAATGATLPASASQAQTHRSNIASESNGTKSQAQNNVRLATKIGGVPKVQPQAGGNAVKPGKPKVGNSPIGLPKSTGKSRHLRVKNVPHITNAASDINNIIQSHRQNR